MKILDTCCGSRMFWFNKENEDAIYMDNRTENTRLCDGRKLIVKPDIIADFRDIPFEDESFYLVVFDPPHLIRAGEKSFLKLKYGRLDTNWKDDIKQNGTLIFKWNEEQISFSMIKNLLPCEPVIGQRRGKTIWLIFFKG